MPTAPPEGITFAYQNSPGELGLFLVIGRTVNYPVLDMTLVTTVSVLVTFPGGAQVTWTLTPVSTMTTHDTLVASRPWAVGDTAILGTLTLVATPYVGTTKLPPAGPWKVQVKGPALS
jgi:hypothetical protein